MFLRAKQAKTIENPFVFEASGSSWSPENRRFAKVIVELFCP
jgi:hypothetical protein